MTPAEFLVCHDYGTGGLWWWITAESAEQITRTYNEVRVFEQAPEWWTPEFDRKVTRISIDQPDEALSKLVKNP